MFLLHLLCDGATSACLKHMETKDFTELLIDSRMKFVNISGFSLIILVGVSDY